MKEGKGVLFVVSTPIGNLEDITFRALRVLKEVDVIACEDTRHSRKLLAHYGIDKPLVSYYAPREARKAREILLMLQRGEKVALMADAGTPLLSDPGWLLVKGAIDHGIPVVPIPGPSALMAALVASGLPLKPFTFWGFLPRKKGELKGFLEEKAHLEGVHVFFESPRRILVTMEVMLEVWGDRRAVVARELTKIHEEFIRGTLSTIMGDLASRGTVKGEMVLMVEGGGVSREPWVDKGRKLLDQGFSVRDVAKVLKVLYGVSRREVYSRLKEEQKGLRG